MEKRHDWQLPAGVSRGLWDYTQSESLAAHYDESLFGSTLPTVDCQFVHHHCAKPGRLIDLGCGTSRLAIAMAERGHQCVGVDLSEAMLRVSAEKARAAKVELELVHANLVELDCFADARFDYAVCLFSTLGMISGTDARRRMLAHVYRMLKPGGVFVVHVHNRWFNFLSNGARWNLLRDLWNDLMRRPGGGDRSMPAHGDVPAFSIHLFTRREVIRMIRAAGFAVREFQGVSLAADGKLRWPGWFGWMRAYGYLVAAVKPADQLH